jgi:hypothetical protein
MMQSTRLRACLLLLFGCFADNRLSVACSPAVGTKVGGHAPCRWAHLPLVGRHIQNAFFRGVEHAAVLALAFCHAHEITLKDLATYGVLQARPVP